LCGYSLRIVYGTRCVLQVVRIRDREDGLIDIAHLEQELKVYM